MVAGLFTMHPICQCAYTENKCQCLLARPSSRPSSMLNYSRSCAVRIPMRRSGQRRGVGRRAAGRGGVTWLWWRGNPFIRATSQNGSALSPGEHCPGNAGCESRIRRFFSVKSDEESASIHGSRRIKRPVFLHETTQGQCSTKGFDQLNLLSHETV